MNLHLHCFNKPNKNTHVSTFYRIMWLTLLLAFFGGGARAQMKTSNVTPSITTNGGGTMLVVGDGGGGGGVVGCTLPTISTNISGSSPQDTYNVTVNGTAPQFTIFSNNATSYQWYKSTTIYVNDFVAIPGATGTTYTPDVSTTGTLYYVGNAINSCGPTGTPMATVIVSSSSPAPVAGTISGSATVCAGTNNTALTLSGYTGTIQWQSSTDNTNFTNISGATGATYSAVNLSATTWYRVVVTSGGSSSNSTSVPVNVTPSTSAGSVIAGTSTQCVGSTTTYTVSGAVLNGGTGSWSSSNNAVAIVDPNLGMVTAVGAGTCNIIYTVSGATCSGTLTASQPYTVTPSTSAGTVIAGTSPQCIGSTTTYTVSGAVLNGGTGSWSSDNTLVATVSPLGLVTAVGAGTCNIKYTVSGATCSGNLTASQSYTVNPNASAGTVIAGTSTQCIGSTTTYTVSGAVLAGGTGAWTSDNTAVATVDNSGVVTAIGGGTCNISYTINGATCGGIVKASQPYTVNPNASAGTVTAGASPQCIGSTTTYSVSNAVLNGGTGSWSSSNPLVATVSSSGLVTAIGGGTCNIIYTVTGGCGGTVAASQPYSVISSIDASADSYSIAYGSPVSLSATISPAISGVTVTFTLSSGTSTTTYTAVTNSSGIATTSAISGIAVNLYKVLATAAGCATSNAAYLSVYDPNGSFVTGGGWITSPPGALVAQPTLTGKADFGFIAKYQRGSNLVDGNTVFEFQDANFNFTSSSLDAATLVISGPKATYTGVGTVNGAGNYGFRVTAVDGQISGSGGTDLFRIKIWDKSQGNIVVYDNNMGSDDNSTPTTALGGGSIIIHYSNTTSRLMNTSSNVAIVNTLNQQTGTGKLIVKVMPNPSTGHFSLKLSSLSQQNLKVIVTDILGRVIDLSTNIQANSTIQLGEAYQRGVYIAELMQGNDVVTLKLIKE